jgi:hypothetical protein
MNETIRLAMVVEEMVVTGLQVGFQPRGFCRGSLPT